MVRASDPTLHRNVIGAEVRVKSGTRPWTTQIQPGQSFQCSNDLKAHFGLGNVERVESIEIRWHDGKRERFPCASVDHVVDIERDKGEPIDANEERQP